MEHPPIAPKSIIVWNETFGVCSMDANSGCHYYEPDNYPQDRIIVAAVAEVEWRKRADRWTSVRLKRFRRGHTGLKSHNMVLYSNACHDCAEAWREWAKESAK